jgi:2-haloacid dehalogenase
MDPSKEIRALLFDVYGTVVDWRSSIIAEGARLSRAHRLDVDWATVADRWRTEGYLRPIQAIVRGAQPWAPINAILREHLHRLAREYGFAGIGEVALERLSLVWDRLEPWPDVVVGLDLMRTRYLMSPLSNGTFGSLTRLGRHAGLRWDCILSADLFLAYKPDPRTYEGAARFLGLEPPQIMLVAAHPSDLAAARRCGLRTAHVPRPREWGPHPPARDASDPDADVVADSFVSLAHALGIPADPPSEAPPSETDR